MSSVTKKRTLLQVLFVFFVVTGLTALAVNVAFQPQKPQGENNSTVLPASTVAVTSEAEPVKAEPAEAEPAEAEPAEAEPVKEDNPTFIPTLKWLPAAQKVENAEATAEAEMKPYTETIPSSDVKFTMVPIPGGEFLMGSPEEEADRQKSEGPQRRVKIAPFWMGKCEVTWNEYDLWAIELDKKVRKLKKTKPDAYNKLADALTAPTPAYSDMTFGMGHDDYPAICMTQLSAKVYCKWLSAKTGHYYRLPTEAEWEYACRAGSKTAYCFGDDPDDGLDDYAWYYENSDEQYQKVGTKKPNAWGLHDMHGNVAEWVFDQFTEDGYPDAKGKLLDNPLNVPKELYPRIVRGGHWDEDAENLRSASRLGSEEGWKNQDPQYPQSIWYHTDADFVGFRIVRPLVKPSIEASKVYEPESNYIKDYKSVHTGEASK